MTDFLSLWHSPTTLVVLLVGVAYAVFHRMSNASVTMTWQARTTEPEASELRRERDEARRAAAEKRDGEP